MKCRAWVTEKTYRTKGAGEPRTKLVAEHDAYPRVFIDSRAVLEAMKQGAKPSAALTAQHTTRTVMVPDPPTPKSRLCGGTITAKVEAVDEAYMWGTSALFQVTYTCAACGWSYHGPDLPDDAEGVSRLLTEMIATLPDPT